MSEEPMMDAIAQWFRDWSDACEFANECAPDLSFLTLREPYSALLGFAAACFLIAWRNERALARDRQRLAHMRPAQNPGAADAAPAARSELARALERLRNAEPAQPRQAA